VSKVNYNIKEIIGDQYSLKPLFSENVSEQYVNWLNDPKVNNFLEVRYIKQNIDSVREYVMSFHKDEEKYLWGIYTNQDSKHIGTISLYDINRNHNRAEIGMIIGDINYWGKTASMDAINMVLNFSFNDLNLYRITGGSYSTNIGMAFTFKQLGFVREATLRCHYKVNNQYIDGYRWGILANEWNERRNSN